jgi:hypothetical protein
MTSNMQYDIMFMTTSLTTSNYHYSFLALFTNIQSLRTDLSSKHTSTKNNSNVNTLAKICNIEVWRGISASIVQPTGRATTRDLV